ncbi:hypothetical protein VN12_08835 [Pirellula sp. SH-Sr6A]|nr:hypothetical protein VN12_08835 [Pirellula sp. SH-Sr6A]
MLARFGSMQVADCASGQTVDDFSLHIHIRALTVSDRSDWIGRLAWRVSGLCGIQRTIETDKDKHHENYII